MPKNFWFLVLVLFLAACSEDPSERDNQRFKPEKGDIVDRHGQVDNLEQLDRFVADVNAKKPGETRIVRYTIEGDPILHLIEYDGERIQLDIDSTHDKYGSGSVQTSICKNVLKAETDLYLSYSLTGCEGGGSENQELLMIEYDVSRQDRFEFELKYGESEVIKSDSFSADSLHQIYKKMVLNAYLNEKELKTCSSGPGYNLTVWINGAVQNYEWGSCDEGRDAGQMTEIADEIKRLAGK